MRHSAVLGRRAFKVYVLVLIGMLLYLHYYSKIRLYDSASVVLSGKATSNSGAVNHLRHQHTHSQQPERTSSRFILSLNYWEQFTMATTNLLSLVCLGSKWNATTVQPFTFNSRLYGLQNFKPDDNFRTNKSAHSLDLIYNTQSLTQVLLKQNLPQLQSFQTFLSRATRRIVVAHYISPRETHELIVMKGGLKDKIEQGFREDFIIDCMDYLSTYRNMIENALNNELQSLTSQNQFHIVKYWCINMTVFSTPHKSAMKMGFGEREDLSIVVVNWRGLGKTRVVRSSVKGLHLNNRVAMLDACKQRLSTSWHNLISYSRPVLQTATQFAASLGLSPKDTFAAVHIRSEKLGLREPRLPGITKVCFEELMRLKDGLAHEYPSLKFIYITDYGPYSSDTCKRCRGSRDVKTYLLQRNIDITYFDPIHFNMTLDKGFAAAVESQFLSSASFLFLCGGGGYQSQIATRFQALKQKMNTKTVFRVCNNDSSISTLLKAYHSNALPSGT